MSAARAPRKSRAKLKPGLPEYGDPLLLVGTRALLDMPLPPFRRGPRAKSSEPRAVALAWLFRMFPSRGRYTLACWVYQVRDCGSWNGRASDDAREDQPDYRAKTLVQLCERNGLLQEKDRDGSQSPFFVSQGGYLHRLARRDMDPLTGPALTIVRDAIAFAGVDVEGFQNPNPGTGADRSPVGAATSLLFNARV